MIRARCALLSCLVLAACSSAKPLRADYGAAASGPAAARAATPAPAPAVGAGASATSAAVNPATAAPAASAAPAAAPPASRVATTAGPWGVTPALSSLFAPESARGRGGYYLDDGPADNIPLDLETVTDASPRNEPLHRFANNPYSVFGRDYTPFKAQQDFKQTGVASWYGRRFHGKRTSSGEPYDMFAMTAAHPTLPIPSYARVTNPANGRSVVVRINDRGPFHPGRVIDLSYTAAWKLGYVNNGSTLVHIETIVPEGAVLALQGKRSEPDPIEQIILNDARRNSEPPIELKPEAEMRGVFLQLAAFSNRDNADSFRAHLARELGGLADKLVLHSGEGRYRLRLGPYANDLEARGVSDKVRERLSLTPIWVTR